MADVELVIKIDEKIYKTLKTVTNIVYGFRSGKTFVHACLTAIRNGTPLPKGQGRLIERVLNAAETLKHKTKTGHWIIKGDKKQGYDICGVKTWYIETMCSECGFINTAIEGHTAQYNYCPECGAKMESEAAEL